MTWVLFSGGGSRRNEYPVAVVVMMEGKMLPLCDALKLPVFCCYLLLLKLGGGWLSACFYDESFIV